MHRMSYLYGSFPAKEPIFSSPPCTAGRQTVFRGRISNDFSELNLKSQLCLYSGVDWARGGEAHRAGGESPLIS